MAKSLKLTARTADGQQYVRTLETPARLTIGRSTPAEWTFDGDPELSALHCEVWWEGDAWHIRDDDSQSGTSLNGERIEKAVLTSGARISAGGLEIVALWEQSDAQTPFEKFLRSLRSGELPLYALLDAARGEQVWNFLRKTGDRSLSL